MIKCVAIDDEPIALSIIKEYCKRYGDMELQCFTSPILGMKCIHESLPDIVFLDIEMNSHNGVELAKELPPDTCLIFTTAYSNYALDGFNVNAVDFLHKPIFYSRFERAMEKALKYLRKSEEKHTSSSIILKVVHKNIVIDTKDITFIEAMDNYVKVFRNNLPTIVSQITMKEIEAMLPTDRFIRVHRSFIVATAAIEKFTNKMIFLQNSQKEIPVGRKYQHAFNKVYSTNNNKN